MVGAINKTNKYILFGAGKEGLSALAFLGGHKVAYFCDNQKYGQYIQDKKVISFDELKLIYQEYNILITTSIGKYIVDIAMQLRNAEIPFKLFEQLADEFVEKDLVLYNKLNKRSSFNFNTDYEYKISLDKMMKAGTVDSYFWQDLWAAQKIYQNKPNEHCDIGSRIDGFIAHLLSFNQKVKLFDIRPLDQTIPGVEFVQCDATNLENIVDDSIESISALCSLEHFGLGRYGDPIDPEACFKCFKAIQKKVKKGGKVYISVPIGREHLEFNAHRVFFAETIIKSFSQMNLLEFSTTNGNNIEYNENIGKYDSYDKKGGILFGLFMLEKK